MIIHSIVTENLLKYERLELKNIPEHGLIGISGFNESGKSSIGESICFALFGRSFAVNEENLQKLIRWRAINCTAEMEFSARDGARYRVFRYLDRDGNHSARLSKSDSVDQPLARGGPAVTEAVHELLGFAYNEFIESFYLAQREISTPHPHSHAVKTMAGVAPMETCRDGFHEDFTREEQGLRFARDKAQEAAARLKRLDYRDAELSVPQEQRDYLRDLDAAAGQQIESLQACAREYREREPEMRAAESRRGMAAGLRFVAFALAALGLGLWELLGRFAHSEAGLRVSEWLQHPAIGWRPEYTDGLLYGGTALAVLGGVFWYRVRAHNARIAELRHHTHDLKQVLEEIDALQPALREQALAAPDDTPDAETQRLSAAQREPLLRRLNNGAAGTREVDSAVTAEADWLAQARQRLRQRIDQLDGAIEKARGRLDTHTKLTGVHEAFEQQARQHAHNIQVCELADELLLGSSRYLSRRFNYNLRGLVGKTLPLFTEGRYEHLQIDEELTVRAFSNEKRDFVGLDEISSGTQRQIMLALRLSLSQELINQVVKFNQFTFLDEPFAFFDEERTRSSLEVLPKLSDDINQIWIVAQVFPKDVAFDKQIHCQRGLDWYSDV